MKTAEIIACMRELINCYEYCNNPNPTNMEVNYWRRRFIEKYATSNDEKIEISCNAFLFLSSESFMKTTPEDFFKEME